MIRRTSNSSRLTQHTFPKVTAPRVRLSAPASSTEVNRALGVALEAQVRIHGLHAPMFPDKPSPAFRSITAMNGEGQILCFACDAGKLSPKPLVLRLEEMEQNAVADAIGSVLEPKVAVLYDGALKAVRAQYPGQDALLERFFNHQATPFIPGFRVVKDGDFLLEKLIIGLYRNERGVEPEEMPAVASLPFLFYTENFLEAFRSTWHVRLVQRVNQVTGYTLPIAHRATPMGQFNFHTLSFYIPHSILPEVAQRMSTADPRPGHMMFRDLVMEVVGGVIEDNTPPGYIAPAPLVHCFVTGGEVGLTVVITLSPAGHDEQSLQYFRRYADELHVTHVKAQR